MTNHLSSPTSGIVSWTAADYSPTVHGHSAEKLLSSAVAPIVAAARGYRTIQDSGRSAAKGRYGLPAWNSPGGVRLLGSLSRGDVLIMPWFTPEDAATATDVSEFTAVQYRPDVPQTISQGKGPKYEFPAGTPSIIGLHPATPSSWLTAGNTVVVAEGLLKADAILSGLLVASKKVTEEELLWTHDEDADPLARLAELMARLEPSLRVPVLTLVGVYNWTSNPEWNTVRLKDKTVLLAVDADITTNQQVHQAVANLGKFLLTRKCTKVNLLTPVVESIDAAAAKLGVDDYLAQHGNWQALLACATDGIPANPTALAAGAWFMDVDACTTCFVQQSNTSDDPRAKFAVPVLGFAARITRITTTRKPTTAEMKTGYLETDDTNWNRMADSEIDIEVSWRDEHSNWCTATISGPTTILQSPPGRWAQDGAHTPDAVLMLPQWPPVDAGRNDFRKGSGFLEALKQNAPQDIQRVTRWATTGWTPTPAGIPDYVIGTDVICADPNSTWISVPGVTDDVQDGATSFGVGLVNPATDFDDPVYRARLTRDLKTVFEVFVENEPWTDKGTTAAVLATALRPAMTLRPAATLYLTGPPQKGKSMTASNIMGFWSVRPGAWGGDVLPGTASDTRTATELAMSRTPIWVLDDLHPTLARGSSHALVDAAADAIRAQFNGKFKARARSGPSGLRGAPSNIPRSGLVVTAENEIPVLSVQQRTITATITDGSLSSSRKPTQAVTTLCMVDGAPSRLVQGLIRYQQWLSAQHDEQWAGLIADQRSRRVELGAAAALHGLKDRAAFVFADFAIALDLLGDLARELRVDGPPSSLGTDDDLLTQALRQHLRAQSDMTATNLPGQSLLSAIRTMLDSGQAHVVNAFDPTTPPRHELASALGWTKQGDGMKGGGLKIGYIVTFRDQEMLLFNQDAAFTAAQKHYPDLVPPGHTTKGSWSSVLTEGLLHPTITLRSKTSARVKDNGTTVNGAPVLLSRFLAGFEDATGESER